MEQVGRAAQNPHRGPELCEAMLKQGNAVRFPLQPQRTNLMESESPPTNVIVFEATEMGCQLFSHVLNRSSYGAAVLGYSTGMQDWDASLASAADVALISADLKDGPGAGFSVLRRLHQYKSTLRCVVLLGHDDPRLIVEAFRCGASGVCAREDSCETLCKCIHQVHRGQIWANSQQLHYLLQAFAAESPRLTRRIRVQAPLTKREQEIVSLVVAGQRNRDIAEHLKLSEHTIKNHLSRVFEKLGVSSRSEIIASPARQRQYGALQGPPNPMSTDMPKSD
jgi:DNA-binding NarL/FixJ family response regulator